MKRIVHTILALIFMGGAVLAQGGYGVNEGARGPRGPGNHAHGPPMVQTMHPRQFQRLLVEVDRTRLERDKMKVVRRNLRNEKLRSNQVRQLVDRFTFERSKIRVAQFAYLRTVDPQNFNVVYGSFRFHSSVREVRNFVALNQIPDGECNMCATGSCTHNHGGGGVGVNYGAGPGVGYNAPATNHCSDLDFQNLIRAMERNHFDDERLALAQQATRGRMLSAVQVRDIMGRFTFESTKLDFAKFAYTQTWDRQNYWMVTESLTFHSSKRELDNYITRVG